MKIDGISILIDRDDEWRLKKWTYHLSKFPDGRAMYFARFSHGKAFMLHREITNCPRGLVVDHINGDTLDNRKSNLRICTISENSRNRKTPITNRLGIKGVRKVGRKYYARIWNGRERILIGKYKTPEEARDAYNNEAVKYFGEFARVS